MQANADGAGGGHPAASHPLIDVQWNTAAFANQATIDAGSLPATATPQDFGQVQLATGTNSAGTKIVTLSYAGSPGGPGHPRRRPLRCNVNVSMDTSTLAVTFEFASIGTQANVGSLTWDPGLTTSFTGQVGVTQVTIAWVKPPVGEDTLTLSIATPLPLPPDELKVLRLDGNYPAIVPGSDVVIDSADPAAPRSSIRSLPRSNRWIPSRRAATGSQRRSPS